MKKIGIMGGTFDPIHLGHLLLGKQALEEYQLDQIWFMPAKQPPHKKNRDITAVKDRYQMVQLAIAGYPNFLCSDFEFRRNGDSYTAQTIKLLTKEYSDHIFYLIIGADSLYEIENWYRPELILSSVTLLVANRIYQKVTHSLEAQIAYLKQKYNAKILLLHSEVVDISSTLIRTLLAKGESVSTYLPISVQQYISEHRLYQED